jgi:hypothetical protein
MKANKANKARVVSRVGIVYRASRSRIRRVVVLLVSALGSMLVAGAAYAYGDDGLMNDSVDTATSQALEMQRSGLHAGGQLSMSGDQASASYARYLKSFDTPIPAFFSSSLKSDSGSSGATSSGQ